MLKIFHAQNRVQDISIFKNGYLYNKIARSNVNIAPTNWKIPELSDWQSLSNELGGDASKVAEPGTEHWEDAWGNNSSGLTLFGSGQRNFEGSFTPTTLNGIKKEGYYGCGASSSNDYWIRNDDTTWYLNSGTDGSSVRLLYTGIGTPTTLTDYDGNIYNVVLIGSQYWIGENWKCTHLNDGTVIPNVTDGTAWSNLTTPGLCAYDNDENNV